MSTSGISTGTIRSGISTGTISAPKLAYNTFKETKPINEKIIGDGKNVTWTFDASVAIPTVRIFERTADKDGDETVTTLRPCTAAEVDIEIVCTSKQLGASVRVTFPEAPPKQSRLVVIA